MGTLVRAQAVLTDYLSVFIKLAQQFSGNSAYSDELESVINQYSAFVTSEANTGVWDEIMSNPSKDIHRLVEDLRKYSAKCVAIMEKIRALKLLSGQTETTDYFRNIEASIQEEFGGCGLKANSKVLMIGSGSFPMTPLFIAKQTGAAVLGIDIDVEAIELGKRVVERLGSECSITLTNAFVENLSYTKEATHIIFSSTIEKKYAILDQLHAITNEQVVVAMRFGDHLKSLFNYPKEKVDERKWRLA